MKYFLISGFVYNVILDVRFEITRVKRSDYWLITPNQQTFCIETNIF